jgi:hypothetical protein
VPNACEINTDKHANFEVIAGRRLKHATVN